MNEARWKREESEENSDGNNQQLPSSYCVEGTELSASCQFAQYALHRNLYEMYTYYLYITQGLWVSQTPSALSFLQEVKELTLCSKLKRHYTLPHDHFFLFFSLSFFPRQSFLV